MLELGLLLMVAVSLSIYAGRLAPERGRRTSVWTFWVVAAAVLGFAVGSFGAALAVRAHFDPIVAVLLLNPIVLACAAALVVVLLLHRLPVAALRLNGTSWEFDRLDVDDAPRVVLSLSSGIQVRSQGGESVVGAADINKQYVDGECLVLECGAEIGRLVLRPAGLASREGRMRFVEAVSKRMRQARDAATAPRSCPKCAAENDVGAVLCAACGHALQGAQTARKRSSLGQIAAAAAGVVVSAAAVHYGWAAYKSSENAAGKKIQATAVRSWAGAMPSAREVAATGTLVTDHGIAVDFPSSPTKSASTERTPSGPVSMTTYEASVGHIHFALDVAVHQRVALWNVQRSLEGSLDGAMSGADAPGVTTRLLNRRPRRLGHLPGIDAAFAVDPGFTGRLWVLQEPPQPGAGAVSYLILVLARNQLAADPRISDFFASVHLVK